jgi:hypothetical protein
MRRKLKVIAAFALLGFVVPWGLLALGYFESLNGHVLSYKVFLWLCPMSVVSLGLDSASLVVGLLGWLMISLTNAILYGVAGIVVSVFVPKSAP